MANIVFKIKILRLANDYFIQIKAFETFQYLFKSWILYKEKFEGSLYLHL